jgi:acyl-CoA synthetase (AMP-forming)/AMP-acid ligase II
MFFDLHFGTLTEPLTGRRWDRAGIFRRICARVSYYRTLGLSNSDLVFVHYGNTLEFFVDLLAVWILGGCVVPIDPERSKYEVETMARAAMPRFSLWLGNPEEAIARSLTGLGVHVLDIAEIPETGFPEPHATIPSYFAAIDDPALVLFTSGTTGDPKGVVHTHRSLRARWTALDQSLGTGTFHRTLCLLPTHFGHGLICNCLFPWLSGKDLFILPPFRPEVISGLGNILDEHRITFMSSVPPVWRLAMKISKPPRTRGLQRVCCGSAPLSALLWKGIQDWTGTTEVINAYGITETGSWAAGTTMPGFTPEDGLVGEPWGGVIKVLDGSSTEFHPITLRECAPGEDGHVWINTPSLMKGYLGRDDLTRKVVSHGWFVTGDLGVIDDRGLLFLKGREREEINKGGMKVYPADIDAVAERHGLTQDVCTFGFEDPLLGENVGMAVVLKETNDANLRNLIEWLRNHLGKHQIPQRFYVLEEIPRTSRGKVNRSKVADHCASRKTVDLRDLFR